MDFEQFQEQAMEAVKEHFPELSVEMQEVNKLQGQSYTGMAVKPEGSNIAATINLQPVFDRVEAGDMSVDAAIRSVIDTVSQVSANMPQFDVRTLMDYDQMKDTLTMQMIPVAGNENRLNDIPHQIVEDMAVVYRFEMESNEQGSSSILVTNTMVQNYGIEPDQLHADALEAAQQNHPATLRNMNDVMRELMGDFGASMIPDEPSPLWVASIEGGQNGACAIQYPGFMDQAAETLGGDFFVLPSSVHEVLFIPDDGSMELANLEEMVQSINQTEVAPADRLSDSVFHYDSEARIFENARTFEAREAMQEQMLADEPAPGMSFWEAEQAESITVLMVNPGERPYEMQVGTELEDLQAVVGGSIEVAYPFDDNVGLIMNEEGKLEGLPLNRALRDDQGEVYDIVAGPFMVVGLTEDSFGSLTKEQLSKFSDMFQQPEGFIKMGKSIMAFPIPEESTEKKPKEAVHAAEKAKKAAKPKHKKSEHDGH
nr:DUF5688 family protein [Fournierella massiliensis]